MSLQRELYVSLDSRVVPSYLVKHVSRCQVRVDRTWVDTFLQMQADRRREERDRKKEKVSPTRVYYRNDRHTSINNCFTYSIISLL